MCGNGNLAAIHMTYKALLIGRYIDLMRPMPKLLGRAGFEVDVITTAQGYNTLKPVRQVWVATDAAQLLTLAAARSCEPYDLIVIGDDEVLLQIVGSHLSDDIKLRLLPVCSVENFRHIGSKVRLSQLLQAASIPTPAFTVVNNVDALKSTLLQTLYPVMLKNDVSAGGAGVFPYATGDNLQEVLSKPLVYPLLVQQRIEGDLLDLSGFYQHGALIHFSYSSMTQFVGTGLGPSSVRHYAQLATVPAEVFELLRKLGQVLGAHGFVNTTCLRDRESGQHFLIEADMRANTWVDYARYLGDDPAIAIRQYFDSGRTLTNPQPFRVDYPKQLVVPYVYRLTAKEILTNRYRVWDFCRDVGKRELVIERIFKPLVCEHIKPWISSAHWEQLQRVIAKIMQV